MEIINKKDDLTKFLNREKNLGFVPTMGSLHKGHLSLIKKSIKECKKTIVTIFVNKPQFNKKNDFYNYPKNLIKDINLLKKFKISCLYIPSENEIYPDGVNKRIQIDSFSKKLCGKHRPGHFEAVVDVIDRFIKIINPKKIFMGEKDFQQFKIVESFVNKYYKNIVVVCCDTIRDKNGTALSSRNVLLTKKEKLVSGYIYKFLKKNKINIINKKFSEFFLKNYLLNLGVNKIDYIKILDTNKIIKPYLKKKKYKIFIAYYLGSTRLVDNI